MHYIIDNYFLTTHQVKCLPNLVAQKTLLASSRHRTQRRGPPILFHQTTMTITLLGIHLLRRLSLSFPISMDGTGTTAFVENIVYLDLLFLDLLFNRDNIFVEGEPEMSLIILRPWAIMWLFQNFCNLQWKELSTMMVISLYLNYLPIRNITILSIHCRTC